jgi:hypothetical protein
MLIRSSEKVKSNFEGTVVDIETVGDFCCDYDDSRRYCNIRPTVLGYIDKRSLNVICAKEVKGVEALKKEIIHTLPRLRNPLFAFNCCFEQGVLFHSCQTKILFKGELNEGKFESKRNAIATLEIGNYDDPFNDRGSDCKQAWLNKQYELVIRHNRSCLLKERDILLKRGCREPDSLALYSI